jgi:quinol monooxygenase YgiN
MTTLLSMALVLLFELRVEPSKTEEFLAYVAQEIAASRNFEGNRRFDILVDRNEPGKIVFYEEWESVEARQRYWSWREARGDKEKLQQYLLSPPIVRSFEKAM